MLLGHAEFSLSYPLPYFGRGTGHAQISTGRGRGGGCLSSDVFWTVLEPDGAYELAMTSHGPTANPGITVFSTERVASGTGEACPARRMEAGGYSRRARRITLPPRSSRARVTCLIGVFSVWRLLHDGERGEISCGCCNSVGLGRRCWYVCGEWCLSLFAQDPPRPGNRTNDAVVGVSIVQETIAHSLQFRPRIVATRGLCRRGRSAFGVRTTEGQFRFERVQMTRSHAGPETAIAENPCLAAIGWWSGHWVGAKGVHRIRAACC